MMFKKFYDRVTSISMSVAREPKKLEHTKIIIRTTQDVDYDIKAFEYDPRGLVVILRAERRSPAEVM